jgi:hypothetical protein
VTRLREDALTITVALLAMSSFALFTWAEYGYFCDQAKSHHEACPPFWSAEHIHDWAYNAAANWQSELIFGVLIVVLLHKLEGRDGRSET